MATTIDDNAADEKSDKSIWRLLNIRCTRTKNVPWHILPECFSLYRQAIFCKVKKVPIQYSLYRNFIITYKSKFANSTINGIAIKVLSIKIRNNFHRFNWISLLIIMVPTSVRYIIYIRESTPTINLFFTELMPPRSSARMNISVNPTRVCINGNLCLTIRTFLRCRCSRFFFFVMIQLFSRTIHNSHNRKDYQCHDQEIQHS